MSPEQERLIRLYTEGRIRASERYYGRPADADLARVEAAAIVAEMTLSQIVWLDFADDSAVRLTAAIAARREFASVVSS